MEGGGGGGGSADSSEDENLPPPHGLFSSLFFFFLLASCSFGFHPLLPAAALGNGWPCVSVCARADRVRGCRCSHVKQSV